MISEKLGADLSFTAGQLGGLIDRADKEGATLEEIADRCVLTPATVDNMMSEWRHRYNPT